MSTPMQPASAPTSGPGARAHRPWTSRCDDLEACSEDWGAWAASAKSPGLAWSPQLLFKLKHLPDIGDNLKSGTCRREGPQVDHPSSDVPRRRESGDPRATPPLQGRGPQILISVEQCALQATRNPYSYIFPPPTLSQSTKVRSARKHADRTHRTHYLVQAANATS